MHALLQALIVVAVMPLGFLNRDLRAHLAHLLGCQPGDITQGQMTHRLRQLRLHGLIMRIEGSHRYSVTQHGLATALWFTRVRYHLNLPALAQLTDPDPPLPTSRLRRAYTTFDRTVADTVQAARLAA